MGFLRWLWCGLRGWEVDCLDNFGGAHLDTLPAQSAFVEVDIRHVAAQNDGIELAFLGAFAATDTGGLASLHGNGALVLVDTRHKYTTPFDSFLAELDDAAWTGLATSTAGSTAVFIDLRESCFGVDMDGIKLAGFYTVATAQTAIAASRLASTTGMHGGTGAQSHVLGGLDTLVATAAASHYCYFGVAIGNGHPQKIGHPIHGVGTTNGAVQSVDATFVGTFYKGLGQSTATGKAAATTIGSGQQLVDLLDARVFVDSKLFGAGIEYNGCHQSYATQNNHRNQKKIHIS